MTELTLLRHGAVDGKPEVFRGRRDVELSRVGWATMRTAARRLAANPPQLVFASPLRRCREPAEHLARELDVPLHVLADLREMDFGLWEERAPSEVSYEWPDALASLYDGSDLARPPDGEALGELRSRVAAALASILGMSRGRRALVVTHAGVIRALLVELLGLTFPQALRFEVVPGASCQLLVGPDQSASLRSLLPPDVCAEPDA
ncbi:MAG: histidine phosphatase family protein [Steroidobacteraceae bacterium]